MSPGSSVVPLYVWLTPALIALFLYGLGQGLVKKWIGEVPPARFCLYYVLATTIVNLGFFILDDHPPLLAASGLGFLAFGVLAYLFDGAAWILYFQSIVLGPVAIVGTLSAAYPALTIVFARVFLHEDLAPLQYLAVTLVIGGCLGLSYTPSGADTQTTSRRWIPLSLLALVCWASSNTIIKYSYSLPGANEANLAVCSSIGGALTLGVFGLLRGRRGPHSARAWVHSFVPMGMMAGGSLGLIIAARHGPISIVTPLIGSYPVVTLIYAALVLKERITRLQYGCIASIITGIVLCSV
ncbi:MAG TPA: DMT family transporter [Steroidobacteraceae bacterium]|nr:DMT family transporter [Steroidobacteraceae bacterium]